MQIVTLEQLKQLETNQVNEVFGLGTWASKLLGGDDTTLAPKVKFADLDKKWRKIKHRYPVHTAAYIRFIEDVLKPLCPPIKLIGEGSSRTGFACLGGRCLKVAKTLAGVAQNEQEIKFTKQSMWTKNWPCFAQTYDISSDKSLLLTECCAVHIEKAKVAVDLGIGDWRVLKAILWAIGQSTRNYIDLSEIAWILDAMMKQLQNAEDNDNADTARKAKNIILSIEEKNDILDRDAPGRKIFLTLMKFWQQHGVQQLIPGDLMSIDNWGYAIRDGKSSPIVIDAGFSAEVSATFYESDDAQQ